MENGILGFISEEDHYMESVIAITDNKLMHLNCEFDKLLLEHESNLHDIETKIIVECGTDSDLTELYAFEAEDTKQKGKGILSRIIGAVVGFFKKIRDVIFGEPIKTENLPEEIELSQNPKIIEEETKGLIAELKAKLRGKKSAAKKAVKAAAVATGVFVVKKGLIDGLMKDTKAYMDATTKELESLESEVENNTFIDMHGQNECRGIINQIKEKANDCFKIMKEIPAAMNDPKYKEMRDTRREQERQDKIDKKLDKNNDRISRASNSSNDARSQLSRVNQLISDYQKAIDNIGKDNGAKHNNFISKGIAGHDQKRLSELKHKVFLSAKEKEEYRKLSAKYAEGNSDRAKRLSELNKNLNKLKKEKDRLNSVIRGNDATINRMKSKNANLENRRNGSYNTSVIDNAAQVLNANESTIEYFDMLVDEFI